MFENTIITATEDETIFEACITLSSTSIHRSIVVDVLAQPGTAGEGNFILKSNN